MHWTEVAWRPLLTKNKDISRKRKLMKNQFDPTKSDHFIKRNDTFFKKHFPHKTCFPLVLQTKFFKKLLHIFFQKKMFFFSFVYADCQFVQNRKWTFIKRLCFELCFGLLVPILKISLKSSFNNNWWYHYLNKSFWAIPDLARPLCFSAEIFCRWCKLDFGQMLTLLSSTVNYFSYPERVIQDQV